MDRKPCIFIGIPTGSGNIWHGLAESLVHWATRPPFDIEIKYFFRQVPVDNAKNQIVEYFLARPRFTHLCCIDNDMSPANDALDILLDVDKDCISPLIFTIKDKRGNPCPTPLIFKRDGDLLKINTKAEGVAETDILPGGMYLAKRELMEAVEKPVYKYTYSEKGFTMAGTDEHFAMRIHEAGFKIYVHTGVCAEQVVTIGTIAFNNAMIACAEEFSIRKKQKALMGIK